MIGKNPSDAPARAMLGSAYFAVDAYRDAAKTIAPLGERAMHDPTLGYPWAASLVRGGDITQATTVLQTYQQNDLAPDALVLVGQLWTDMGDYSRAVEVFHRALNADPTLAKAHYFTGLAQLRWEHTTEAQDEFNAALKLAPGDPDATLGLGYVYVQQSKQAEAIDLFRSVTTTHPENGNAQYQLGKLLLDNGKVPEAVSAPGSCGARTSADGLRALSAAGGVPQGVAHRRSGPGNENLSGIEGQESRVHGASPRGFPMTRCPAMDSQ